MADTSDAIDQLMHGQHNQFKDTISSLLMDRLKSRIENEKYSVAQRVFDDEQYDEFQIEPEGTSDEEV